MNYSDVFRKSDVGRDEIKFQKLGVLPREARTLLIMIDGKRSYQSYIDSLNDSKMFAEFGGVIPLFELLLELGCIETAGQTSTPVRPQNSQPSINSNKAFDKKNEIEFDRTFNQNNTPTTAAVSASQTRTTSPNYEATKSELAEFIEKNAPAEESWGYLLSLEQCNDANQLLVLVKDMQSSSNKDLLQGLEGFAKRINQQL